MSDLTNVLVLGASGMLGHTVLRFFARAGRYSVIGAVRSAGAASLLSRGLNVQVMAGFATDAENLEELFTRVRPVVVVNCIGLVKQRAEAGDPLEAISINSMLPHRLLQLCKAEGARLIQISTDCVFAGTRGMYREDDVPDAGDLYGRSKLLGEVNDSQAVTLRTSIIGPELSSSRGLLGWFLAQRTPIRGFRRAVFSGLTTLELARVMHDFVIPQANLHGIFHVSSAPINKYELLRLIAKVYGIETRIEPDDTLVIDRSLDSGRFRELVGYTPPVWPEMVRAMHEFG